MTGILLNLTFTATTTAILILLIKRLLGNKAAPRFQFLIWIVLAVQILVFPISENLPESRISIRNYVPEAQQVQKGAYTGNTLPDAGSQADQSGADTADAAAAANVMNVEETGPSEKDANPEVLTITMPQGRYAEVNHSTKNIIGIVWLTGTVITIALYAAAYARCRRSLRALPVCEDREVLEIFEECKRALGIKKNIAVYKGAESTMLAGILKPAVYIKEDFEKDELKYVLMHELCHYKHKDVLWNLAASVYAAAFWFDPVIWFAFRTFRRDIEVYCDDRAIAAITSGSAAGCRREYARVLVKSAAGSSNFVLATTSFIGGEKEVTARIKRIADHAKPKAVFTVIAVCLAALILIACTTSAFDSAPKTESVSLGQSGHQIDVPEEWLSDMRKAEAGKMFFDEEGNLFAEIYNASDNMYTEEEISDAMGTAPFTYIMDPETTKTAIMRHLASRGFSELEEQKLDTSSFTDDEDASGYLLEYYAFTAVKDGKKYNIVAGYSQLFVVIADSAVGDASENTKNERDDISLSALASYLSTVRITASPEFNYAYINIDKINGLRENNYKLADEEYKKYAETLLGEYFDSILEEDMPVEQKIEDFRIVSMEEVKREKGSVSKPDIFVGGFYDDVLWDVIYPKAKAYRISYEIIPHNDKYFDGERSVEKIAVFAVNDYVDGNEKEMSTDTYGSQIGEFYLTGFVDSKDEENCDCSAVIIRRLNDWYTSINPVSPSPYSTDYIGDAATVGKIVNALPLHEYIDVSDGTFSDKALVLQTTKEPYGLTVNYNFTENSPLDKTDEIAWTPIDTRRRKILDSGLNAYVAQQVYINIGKLFDNIGNLGVLTVNLHYTENGEARTETITMSRSDFNLM